MKNVGLYSSDSEVRLFVSQKPEATQVHVRVIEHHSTSTTSYPSYSSHLAHLELWRL